MKYILLAVLILTSLNADLIQEGRAELVQAHYDEAKILFRKSCDSGNTQGCLELGAVYYMDHPKNIKEAVKAYKKACDGGSDLGCKYLSIIKN